MDITWGFHIASSDYQGKRQLPCQMCSSFLHQLYLMAVWQWSRLSRWLAQFLGGTGCSPRSHLSQPLGHADGLPLAAGRSFLADFVQEFLKELPPFLAALHLQVPAACPGARTWPVVPQPGTVKLGAEKMTNMRDRQTQLQASEVSYQTFQASFPNPKEFSVWVTQRSLQQ